MYKHTKRDCFQPPVTCLEEDIVLFNFQYEVLPQRYENNVRIAQYAVLVDWKAQLPGPHTG
jgi:hypothetical protein